MTPDQLEILLQEGEGTILEYKEGLSASFARELVDQATGLATPQVTLQVGAHDEARSGPSPYTCWKYCGKNHWR